MMVVDEDLLQRIEDREAIRTVLAAYPRAIDRRDRALLERLFWPDGHADYGAFKGLNPAFIDWAMGRTAEFERSQHLIGQSLIRVSGARAGAETYFIARQWPLSAPDVEEHAAGRYLDRLEKRGGEWRILERLTCFEWHRREPRAPTVLKPDGPHAIGARAPDDPCYAFLGDLSP